MSFCIIWPHVVILFFFVGGKIGQRVSCEILLAFEGCYRQLDWSPNLALNLSLVCHFKFQELPVTRWHWKLFGFLVLKVEMCWFQILQVLYLSGVNRPAKLNSLSPIPIVVSFLSDCAKRTNDCVNSMQHAKCSQCLCAAFENTQQLLSLNEETQSQTTQSCLCRSTSISQDKLAWILGGKCHVFSALKI